MIQTAQRAAKNLGLEGTLRVTLGGSDANVFNSMGIPSIVVATGMDKIHTHDEFVSVCDRFTNKRLFVTDRHGDLVRDADGSLTKVNYDNEPG